MAYTSVRVVFEIGHEACVRAKKTEQGFTHDWQLYVRGADNSEIQHYVDKVVFHLHETFINPKRIIKEPPFVIRESGYAGFELIVEIYFKNKPDSNNKVKYKYHLTLPELPGAPITNVVQQVYVFNNPSEDFRRRLIKGGGVGVGEESHSSLITHSSQNDNHKNPLSKSKHSPQDNNAVKKSKKENTPRNEEKLRKDDPFYIFGQPINTANIPFTSKSSSKQISDKMNVSDKQTHSSKSSKHNTLSHKDKDREREKERGDKEKHNKSKDRDKDKDLNAIGKKSKEGSPSGSFKKDKNKDGKTAKISKSSSKEEVAGSKKSEERVKEKAVEKIDKDAVKYDKKDKEKKHKDDKKPKQKERHKLEKTDARESPIDRTDKPVKEEKDERKRKEERDDKEKSEKKSSEPRNLNGIFGAINGQSTNDVTKEEKHKHHKHKKDKSKKDNRADKEEKREKPKECKETQPSPKDAKESPVYSMKKPINLLFEEFSSKSDSDSSSLDEDVIPTKCTPVQIKEPILSSPEAARNDDPEKSTQSDVNEMTTVFKKKSKKTPEERESKKKKRKSKNKEETSASKVRKYDTDTEEDKTNSTAVVEQPLTREQPTVESLRQRSLSPVSETKFTDEYITKLKELQRKIMALDDNSGLQRIVQVVAETGQYEITTKTFDFDLCSLDESIVQRLLDFFVP